MESNFAPRGQESVAAIEEASEPRSEAARERLRECKDRKNACEVVREIVSNLLGCEEMALFEVDRKQQRLELIWSFGLKRVRRGQGERVCADRIRRENGGSAGAVASAAAEKED
jgi:Arc/MetJ-type ribon-helix-helix transcriptional regulator